MNRDKFGRFIKGKNSGEMNPHWKGGLPKCIDCGEKVKTRYIKHKFPQRCATCLFLHRVGSNNPNWKNGKTKRSQQVRNSEQYIQWRSRVFERDNWTCQTCYKRGCYLEAHHIKSFSDVLDNFRELWNIDNGVTLCEECHELTKQRDNKGKYMQAQKQTGAK